MTDGLSLSVQDAKTWIDTQKPLKLIDVREDWEREIAHLHHDIHIPLATFQESILDYPKEDTYVVYCHHGRRSLAAVMLMMESGFKNVYNLEGGIAAWADKIDQNMPTY